MRITKLVLIAAMIAGGAQLARAHDDVVPYAFGGKIYTGGHDDIEATNAIEERVFGYDFGEDPGDPYIIGDPGFNNGAFGVGLFPNDGLLPTFKTLAFDILSNLGYWDGTGGVSFSPAAAGIALGLNRASNTAYIPGTGPVTGTVPTIGSTGASGRLHVHLSSLLAASDGTDPSPPNAPDGFYLISLRLKLTDGSLTPSDSIFIVYNNGLDEETHDLAMEWVETNLVPEPASWLLVAMAGAGLAPMAWKRRKRAPRSTRLT